MASSDSFGVMYGARCPSRCLVGYHRVTLSSLALTSRFQGSGREVSFRYRAVVPTGWEPVGAGRVAGPVDVAGGTAERGGVGAEQADAARTTSPAATARRCLIEGP